MRCNALTRACVAHARACVYIVVFSIAIIIYSIPSSSSLISFKGRPIISCTTRKTTLDEKFHILFFFLGKRLLQMGINGNTQMRRMH
jgi:hypothetical protein